MFTIAIFFLVLSILVIIHELGHFITAKLCGIKVEEFGFGIPPRIFGIKIGETLYSLNLLPFGGFVKVFGEEAEELKGKKLSPKTLSRSFTHKKNWQKVAVLCAGVFFNFLLGWGIVSYLFTQGVPVPSKNVFIEEVRKGSPADIQGLKKGDVIQKVTTDKETVIIDDLTDISTTAKKYGGKEILLVIKRGDQIENISIIPRKNPPKNEGSLGIVISNFVIKKYSWTEAPVHGLIESAKMTKIIFVELSKTLVNFVTFQKTDAEISGPVGIARLTSDAARQGSNALLQMIGLLSLNLAVINILPFPALDGGRLALVLYEAISKRKVKRSRPTIGRKEKTGTPAFFIHRHPGKTAVLVGAGRTAG